MSDSEIEPIKMLNDERIVFQICFPIGELTSISAQIKSTQENINIPLHEYKNSQNCLLGNVNSLNTQNNILEIEYTFDSRHYKYTREIIITKKSEVAEILINQDFSRINDPLELSYILLVYNDINGNDHVTENLYNQIRDLRDNDRKCWPNRNCNIVDTSVILYNLNKAGFNENRRLLQDGLIYLNSNILNLSLSTAQLGINFITSSSNNVSCELQLDNSTDPIDFNFNESLNLSNRNFDEKFELNCNSNIDEIIFKISDPNRDDVNFTVRNSNSFEYSRERVLCYGRTNCDIISTLYVMNTYKDQLKFFSELKEYVETYRTSIDSSREFIFSRTNPIHSALYLNVLGNDEKLENFLKFSQNNDGSWGEDRREDRRLVESAIALSSLNNFNDAEEYIKNSKEWIYFNEPNGGWGDTQKNALAYISINKFLKPFLIVEDFPDIIKSDTTQEIQVKNPSTFNIFNIRVNVDDSIRDYISFSRDIGSIRSKESVSGNISSKNKNLVDKKGVITISGIAQGSSQREEFIKLPIIIRAAKFISIEQDTVFFSPSNPIINIEVINEQPEVEVGCEVRNSFNSNVQNILLNQENNSILIENNEEKTGELEIELTCRLDDSVIEIQKKIDVLIHESTFLVELNSPGPLEIDDFNNINIIVRSTSNQEQTIEVKFKDLFMGLIEIDEPEFNLLSDDRRFIRFDGTQSIEILENLKDTEGIIQIKSSTGYIEEVEFIYNHNLEISLIIYLIIGVGIFLSLILILVVYRLIEGKKMNKNNDFADEITQDNAEDELIDLDSLEFK
ncbi:MAG: hypothetical protein ACMXYB_04350 [Candidatus Woesearchaeota archaeon]